MISLWEALGLVMGEADDPPRRALILGAGFAKAVEPTAPLFNDFKEPLIRALLATGDDEAARLHGEVQKGGDAKAWALVLVEVTDLIERLDQRIGRAEVARVILSEPLDRGHSRGPGVDAELRPTPEIQPATFRTLREWAQVIRDHRPMHLKPLCPVAANVILGRLLAEGVIDELLSTNWDAFVELGAMLAGLRIEDAEERRREDWFCGLPQRLRVFETQDELVGRWFPHSQLTLLKLHGGVRTIRRTLSAGPTPESDAALRRSFVASANDLTRWRGATEWVGERVSAALRSHATLLLGVSGADSVMYGALRQQVSDWEDAARRDHQAPPKRARMGGRWPLRLAAVDFGPVTRLRNMMSVCLPSGRVNEPVAEAGVTHALAGLYVWQLLGALDEAAVEEGAQDLQASAVVARVRALVGAELAQSKDPTTRQERDLGPWTLLLLQSLGVGARFTAAALGLGPFQVRALASQPFRRWWSCPWRLAPDGPKRAAYRAATALMARLLERADLLDVEPWTGVITLREGHPAIGALGGRAGSPLNLLLLPCPWVAAFDWRGDALALELSTERFGWGAGAPRDTLGDAALKLVPLGGGGMRALGDDPIPVHHQRGTFTPWSAP
jgi:hypothetical protein